MTDITITLRRTASKEAVRRIPFARIAESILGKRFELSLVMCGDSLARAMNVAYRKKSYFPNVLSFPLSKESGEIFLNIRKAEHEAHRYGLDPRDRIAYLFIHGCFHLKGLDHGAVMERRETVIMRKFGFDPESQVG